MTRASWLWLAQVLATVALGITLAVLCDAAMRAITHSLGRSL